MKILYLLTGLILNFATSRELPSVGCLLGENESVSSVEHVEAEPYTHIVQSEGGLYAESQLELPQEARPDLFSNLLY